MRARYDSEYDILYIDITDKKVHDTQPLDEGILLDLDEEGNIVGIEIWQASKLLSLLPKDGESEEVK
jgi:uncharacterized protein YuzE